MVLRIALLLAVVALGLASWQLGWLEAVDAETLVERLRGAGPWGPVLYVGIFALIEPIGVPGIVFVIPASFVWPIWLAFLLSWVGAVGAGIVGFAFARFVAQDWVGRHLPEGLRRYDDRLAERGLATVILVRVLFFLWPPAHWVLGVSSVRFGTFVIGSAIGFLPGIAALTLAGPALVELWQSVDRPGLWIGGALIAFVIIRRVAGRLRARA
jgi:uncharacterized membrane protein YdjX (TVP38/TMEM64 family)